MSETSRRRKRQILTFALAAISVGGCASPSSRRLADVQPAISTQRDRSDAVAEAGKLLGDDVPADLTTAVQTVGYDGPVTVAGSFEMDLEEEIAEAVTGGGEHAQTEAAESPQQPAVQELPAREPFALEAPDQEIPAQDTSNRAGEAGQPVAYFIDLALASHPQIQAARQRVAAEANRIPQVRALPDPRFNNTFWPIQDQALQTAAGRIANQMSLAQEVPWPEKLRTRGAIVNREVQIAQAEVDRIEREIAESVRLAYAELWYTTRAIAIIEETQDLVDDLTNVAEARYRSGGTQQDVLRAQLESDRLADQLVTLIGQKEAAQADLAALVQQPLSLNPEVEDSLALTDVPEQLDQLVVLAEQCNPELRGLAAEVQRDRQRQRLACLQRYPDLQFGVNFSIVSDDEEVISPVANGHDNISFTVGTTLPIWHEKINAGIREAALRTSSTTGRLQAERDALYGQLRRLLAQADALVEQRAVYEERIIPRIEDTLELAIADYQGEGTDFFSLIETYRELLLFETQLARINATLAGTLAQLDRAVGCP